MKNSQSKLGQISKKQKAVKRAVNILFVASDFEVASAVL